MSPRTHVFTWLCFLCQVDSYCCKQQPWLHLLVLHPSSLKIKNKTNKKVATHEKRANRKVFLSFQWIGWVNCNPNFSADIQYEKCIVCFEGWKSPSMKISKMASAVVPTTVHVSWTKPEFELIKEHFLTKFALCLKLQTQLQISKTA